MLFFVFAAYSLLSLPVRASIQVYYGARRETAIAELCAAGVRIRFEFRIHQRKKRGKKRTPSVFSVIRRAAEIESIEILARIGTGDALHTALAAGGARAAILAWLGALGAPRRTQVTVLPDFTQRAFTARLCCIFSVTAGDIMLSAAKAAIKKRRKEGV